MVGFGFQQIKNKNQGKIILHLDEAKNEKRTTNRELCNGITIYSKD